MRRSIACATMISLPSRGSTQRTAQAARFDGLPGRRHSSPKTGPNHRSRREKQISKSHSHLYLDLDLFWPRPEFRSSFPQISFRYFVPTHPNFGKLSSKFFHKNRNLDKIANRNFREKQTTDGRGKTREPTHSSYRAAQHDTAWI